MYFVTIKRHSQYILNTFFYASVTWNVCTNEPQMKMNKNVVMSSIIFFFLIFSWSDTFVQNVLISHKLYFQKKYYLILEFLSTTVIKFWRFKHLKNIWG